MPKSRIVPHFHEVDFSDLSLPMIVVYDRPTDFPEQVVARIFNIVPGDVQPTDMAMTALTIEEIHSGIPERFTRLNRNPGDDPNILETWI